MNRENNQNNQIPEKGDFFTTPLKGKQKVIALIIAGILMLGVLLSPVISPYLISWISFDGKFWDIAEIVFGGLCFFGLFGAGIWFAIKSVKDLGKTCKEVFGKKD